MKRILYLFILSLSACFHNLDPKVDGKLSRDDLFQTAEDVESATIGLYHELQHFHRIEEWNYTSGFVHAEASTDEFVNSWNSEGFLVWQNFTWTVNSEYTNGAYSIREITKCTNMMFRSQEVVMDAPLKARYLAEMRLIRALILWHNYRLFGPVPVVLDPEISMDPTSNYSPPRPSEQWTVDFILQEVERAAVDLPVAYDYVDYGRMTKGIAYFLGMKVAANDHQWDLAADYARRISDLDIYKLEDNYQDIFDINNEANAEIIWGVPRNNTWSFPNRWLAFVLPTDYVSPQGNNIVGWGGHKIPWKIYDRCFTDLEDQRLATIWTEYHIGNGIYKKLRGNADPNDNQIGAIPVKYSEDPEGIGDRHGQDRVIFRYADVLLIQAEALNQIYGPNEGSVNLINKIRRRAGVAEVTKDQFHTKQDLIEFIMDERFRELFCEGHRRDDLIRNGMYLQKARERGVSWADQKHLRYPIPQWQINQYADAPELFPQNEGY
ncbi:RagB/SusD family nutrient uptake outer membrane protein [Persicobacter diffluens]|uniref:RagB/SusD domain-containing protein n=1 Tax=Persicobacter diffluens TaxID=981 RepID=A0AAN4W5E3_9BACT|nr:hypothetical protein PEDI_49670 [Persicobacter diffluens]